MNDLCKVSILVPIYCSEQYIERCARSLFEQTYNNIEFVFVNDCTLDKSIEILDTVLEKYPHRKPYTKIICHEKNRGVAAARNTLLMNASGDYILWVDSDDFIVKNAVEILVARAIDTNADIICFGTTVHSVRGDKPLALFNGTRPNELIIDLLSGHILTVLWGNMFRHRLFTDNNISFVEGLDIGEDMLVLIKLINYSKVISIEKSIIYYYDDTNDNSLVRSFSIKKADMVITILDMLEEFLKDKLDVSMYIKERKMEALLSILYGTCLYGDRPKYNQTKSILKSLDWKNIKNRKSPFYLFFMKCNYYYINRLWAYILFVLRHCILIKKKFLMMLNNCQSSFIN